MLAAAFLVADEAPAAVSPALGLALKQLARSGAAIGALSAGIYPLAQLGLLDGYRAAVHWRWHDDFTERFPKVIATNHLFDRDRMTACGGMAVLDLLLGCCPATMALNWPARSRRSWWWSASAKATSASASAEESPRLQPSEADPGGTADGSQYRGATDHRRSPSMCAFRGASWNGSSSNT